MSELAHTKNDHFPGHLSHFLSPLSLLKKEVNDILPKTGTKQGSYNSNHIMKSNTQSITPKQLEILLLLYRYRFLNRIQIQKFLEHKNDTRITAWLRDLNKNEYIGRIYSFKLLENTNPAIYYLMTKSRNILKDQEYTTKIGLSHIYREHMRSVAFQNHWVSIGDL